MGRLSSRIGGLTRDVMLFEGLLRITRHDAGLLLRQNKANLSLIRRQRLDELGFVWKPQKGPVPRKRQNIRVEWWMRTIIDLAGQHFALTRLLGMPS
jgi:hypothetical protein